MAEPRAGWTVTVESRGRSGTARYSEGDRELTYDWELGGGRAVAIVGARLPAPGWAAGREAEITRRVAEELVRHKCPGCPIEYDGEASFMLMEPPSRRA